MATPRVIDLDGFDKKRYPKALAAAYPFKLRGQVVALADADTVEVFLDQAFGDTTTVDVRIANLSAAEKRSRDPVEKGLGIAAWAEAQDILYPGRPIGLVSLKPLESFGTSLGRTLGLIEVEEGGAIKDYAALMLMRKRELADEGVELGVWPSEEWPFEGMPPRAKDKMSVGSADTPHQRATIPREIRQAAGLESPVSDPKGRVGGVDHLSVRVAYADTQDPEEASERLATAENHARAKEMGRTTPVFQEEEPTRESMRFNPVGGDPMVRSPFRGGNSGGGPLRDSEDRTGNPRAKDLPRDWQQQQTFSPEEEPVSLKTEPTRIVNIAMVVVILMVQGAGLVLSDEETSLIRQSVEILVEIAIATGLLQYLRTKVWSEATHKTEVRQALYKEPPVR